MLLPLPFVVTHLLNADWLMAGVNLSLFVLLAVTAWVMKQGRPAPVPFRVLGFAIVASVLVSAFRQGELRASACRLAGLRITQGPSA